MRALLWPIWTPFIILVPSTSLSTYSPPPNNVLSCIVTITMDPLPILPSELTLAVISHLRIPEFHTFQRLSKAYNAFFQLNESYIYRNAAIRHNFISDSDSSTLRYNSESNSNSKLDTPKGADSKANSSLKDAVDEWNNLRKGSMAGVATWKDFCTCLKLDSRLGPPLWLLYLVISGLSGQRVYLLERTFEGQGRHPPILRKSTVTGTNVHHFKIDEEHRFIICTHATGGLTVSSFEGDRVFSLDEVSVLKRMCILTYCRAMNLSL